MVKTEKELVLKMKFKKHLEKGRFEEALNIIDEIPENDYWVKTDIQEYVELFGNVDIIKRFVENYNLIPEWSIMVHRRPSDWNELFEYIDKNQYDIPENDLMILFDKWVWKKDSDELLKWVTQRLKQKKAIQLVAKYITKNDCKKAFIHYEMTKLIVEDLPVESFPDLITCVFGINDLKYSELMIVANQKGYDFDFENKGYQYIYDILYNSLENKNVIFEHDTRIERIELLKRLGLKLTEQHYNEIAIALTKRETYSKKILEYIIHDSGFNIDNIIDWYGNTMLINAIINGENEIVEDLLKVGVNVNAGKRKMHEGVLHHGY